MNSHKLTPPLRHTHFKVAIEQENVQAIQEHIKKGVDLKEPYLIKKDERLMPIEYAAKYKYWQSVAAIASVTYNTGNMGYETALFWAVVHNVIEIAKLLIKQNTKSRGVVNEKDGNGFLHRAIDNNNLEMIALLLKANADPSVENKQKFTPIEYAANQHKWEYVRILVQQNVSEQNNKAYNSALLIAVYSNNLDISELLLRKGALPTYRHFLENGNGCLHTAIDNNNPTLIKLLLKYNDNNAFKNKKNRIPIAHALREGEEKKWSCALAIAESKNADVETIESYNNALITAIQHKQHKLALALLKANASTNSVTINYTTYIPLHLALDNKDPEMIALLLHFHANPNLKDKQSYDFAGYATHKNLKDEFHKGYSLYLNHFFQQIEWHAIFYIQASRQHINLPLEVIHKILNYVFQGTEITIDERMGVDNIADKKINLQLISTQCVVNEYSKAGHIKSFQSQSFVFNLKNHLENATIDKSTQVKAIEKEVNTFIMNNANRQSRSIDLLIKYHLFSRPINCNTKLELVSATADDKSLENNLNLLEHEWVKLC